MSSDEHVARMGLIEHKYVTIGPDGEPLCVYTDRERADRDARLGALSVQAVVPEFQLRGAVEENEKLRAVYDAARAWVDSPRPVTDGSDGRLRSAIRGGQ